MLGNGVEMSLIFRRILGPLVLSWAPNHFVLGAQLAPDEKRLVYIPVKTCPHVVSHQPLNPTSNSFYFGIVFPLRRTIFNLVSALCT